MRTMHFGFKLLLQNKWQYGHIWITCLKNILEYIILRIHRPFCCCWRLLHVHNMVNYKSQEDSSRLAHLRQSLQRCAWSPWGFFLGTYSSLRWVGGEKKTLFYVHCSRVYNWDWGPTMLATTHKQAQPQRLNNPNRQGKEVKCWENKWFPHG